MLAAALCGLLAPLLNAAEENCREDASEVDPEQEGACEVGELGG